jgi:hypothetical protein
MFVTKSAGVIFKHRYKIYEVVTRLEKLFPTTIEDQVSNKVGWFCSDLKKKSLVFIFLNTGGVSIYLVTPLFIQLFEMFCMGKSFQSMLPTPMWLWFDHTKRGVYEFSYCLISWSSYQLAFTILVTDLLFCTILCLTSMEFRVLGQKIQNIVAAKGANSLDELKTQVKIHQELIEISKIIETIFSASMLLR